MRLGGCESLATVSAGTLNGIMVGHEFVLFDTRAKSVGSFPQFRFCPVCGDHHNYVRETLLGELICRSPTDACRCYEGRPA